MRGLNNAAHLFVRNVMTGGDLGYFKETADRFDGRAAQSITGADGGPLVIIQATPLDEAL